MLDVKLVKEHAERLAISRKPSDWLHSFRSYCYLAFLGTLCYTSLTQSLVMLGVGRAYTFDKPKDFDSVALQCLRGYGLVKKVRRCLLDDFQRDEEDLNKLCEPGYCLELLAWLK